MLGAGHEQLDHAFFIRAAQLGIIMDIDLIEIEDVGALLNMAQVNHAIAPAIVGVPRNINVVQPEVDI